MARCTSRTGEIWLGAWRSRRLYILDHLFFALALTPTAAGVFTINHIAAVGLPVALGYLWLTSPAKVFLLADVFACVPSLWRR